MAVFKYEWRQLRRYTFWWSMICGFLIFMMLPVYLGFLTPEMMEFSRMADNPVFDLLGVNPGVMTKPVGVFGFLTSFFAIAAGINGMYLGFRAFQKEAVGRSAEFLYTKPFKKRKIFCAKTAAAGLSIFITGMSYFTAGMVSAYLNVKEGFSFGLYAMVALSFFWIQLFFMLLGALAGAGYPKVRTPLLFSAGVVFVFYIFSAYAGKVGAEVLKYFTPFSWFGASVIVTEEGYRTGYLAAMIFFSILFAVSGLSLFTKKDTTLIS